MALSGKLTFNPVTDTLIDADGKPFKLEPPSGSELPTKGFASGRYNSQWTFVHPLTSVIIV
jgi:hypothetical protein